MLKVAKLHKYLGCLLFPYSLHYGRGDCILSGYPQIKALRLWYGNCLVCFGICGVGVSDQQGSWDYPDRTRTFSICSRKHKLYSGLFVLLKLKLTLSRQEFFPISSLALSSFLKEQFHYGSPEVFTDKKRILSDRFLFCCSCL